MASHFGDRLYDSVRGKGSPLCVGLDPVYARLPEEIRTHKHMNDANDVGACVDALFDFSTRLLRIIAPHVCAVKINIGYYERFLWEGLETYFSVISEADALGLEVLGDVKRGDVGHTAQCYADAHLRNPEYTGLEDVITPDAITVNGFAGSEGIVPFADVAGDQGKGVFVWVRSSNPTADMLQNFADASGKKWYEQLSEVVFDIAMQNKRIGSSGYSNVGMVVGGTAGDAVESLRDKYRKVWMLVPGFGSQGASAKDCMRFCNSDGTGALINASRSIIYAYERDEYKDKFGDNWEKCIEQAVLDAKDELARAV